jgi:ethanolamine utilization protein EutQ
LFCTPLQGVHEILGTPYPYNEFIYVLSGSITLVAADGSVLEAKAGESLAIPQGWKGQWKTKGYKKYYALYTEPLKTK